MSEAFLVDVSIVLKTLQLEFSGPQKQDSVMLHEISNNVVYNKQSLRWACAKALSDQSLC